MKRLIKFWNVYSSDGAKFSTCSTRYEILPQIVDDNADDSDLVALADVFKLRLASHEVFVTENQFGRALVVTHSMMLDETMPNKSYGREEERLQVFLGLISLPSRGPLKANMEVGKAFTLELAQEVAHNQYYGVSDYGETVDKETVMIKSGWNYWHEIKLLGYSLESFEKVLGITEHGFEDDTFQCSACNKWDHADNGHTYNHRYVDYDRLGVRCGCYAEHCKENFMDYADDFKKAMELDTAKELEGEGKLKHLECFIGGMTDGRGGYYRGYGSTRESSPEKALKEYSEKFPEKQFLFSHDESGQFQTYFSIWEIVADNVNEEAAS
jgi:hypothetical protein